LHKSCYDRKFVEALGFDWVSVSEHHYSPRIRTPSPVVAATWLAARVEKINARPAQRAGGISAAGCTT
jgi:alkanesulfonate monooxygenase SsuD/methylene tetrahydromethanopterin reductase-like flavin-dependent oxidoreductase (luciferase family)